MTETFHYTSIQYHIGKMLDAMLPDSVRQSPGLAETPTRVTRAWRELLDGYWQEPASILKEFDNDCHYDEMVIVRDVDFTSVCEHHLLPFVGVAHVGYIPNGKKVVGLSKLARIVECFARRLQVQERLTQQIVKAIEDNLEPIGVGCVIEASHQCLACRGAKKANAVMVTSALKGAMHTDARTRSEFLRLALFSKR